ncbi:MAG: hypothetical protein ACTHOO_04115 [Alcanivorax sp.]
MSAEDIESKPLTQAGSKGNTTNSERAILVEPKVPSDDVAPGSEDISKQLQEMVQVAQVAVSVAEDMVRKVEEQADNPDANPEEIEAARAETSDALDRAQQAYEKAQEHAEKGGVKSKKDFTPEELREIASQAIDRAERRARIERDARERELEEERRKKRLADEAIEIERQRKANAEAARKREQEKLDEEERQKKQKEAEKAEQERRKKLNETPEGRAQLAKEVKDQRIAVNATKRRALETVMEALKPRYAKMRGNLSTLFMFPHLKPLRIEQRGKEDEPKLICNFGLLEKTTYGHRTGKFRSVIRSGPKGIRFEVDHQAWRSWMDGRAEVGLTRYDWGTDLHGPKPNPKKNLTAQEAIEDMNKRLDDVEAEHDHLITGRLLRAGVLVAALVGGVAYSEYSKAEPFEGPASDNDDTHIIVGQEAVNKLPGYMAYDADANELLLASSEHSDEPGL